MAKSGAHLLRNGKLLHVKSPYYVVGGARVITGNKDLSFNYFFWKQGFKNLLAKGFAFLFSLGTGS